MPNKLIVFTCLLFCSIALSQSTPSEEQPQIEAEEIAAQKDCLRYPGWRKYKDGSGRSIWVSPDPDDKTKFYGNIWSNQKNKDQTAIKKDMDLCDQASQDNKYLCDDTTHRWKKTIFLDDPQQKQKCERIYDAYGIQIDSQQWIQCGVEDCDKWHKIPQRTSDAIKGEWKCEDSKDERYNSCDKPEDPDANTYGVNDQYFEDGEPIAEDGEPIAEDGPPTTEDGPPMTEDRQPTTEDGGEDGGEDGDESDDFSDPGESDDSDFSDDES